MCWKNCIFISWAYNRSWDASREMSDKMQTVQDVKQVADEDTFDCFRHINELLHSGQINDSIMFKSIKEEIGSIHKLVIAAIQTIQKNGRLIYLTPRASERIHITDLSGPVRLQNYSVGKKYCPKSGKNELLARMDLNELQAGPRDMVICFAAEASSYTESSLRYARKSGAMTASILLGQEPEEKMLASINIKLDLDQHSTAFQRAWLQNLFIRLVSQAASAYILQYELKEISF